MAEELKDTAVQEEQAEGKTPKAAEKPENKPGFFKSVKAEFRKIVWPDKATVARETGAVVFFGVVLGVLIAVIDAVIKYGLGFIL